MNAMNTIRAQVTALRRHDDQWCARHFQGWPRIKFSIAKSVRPISRRLDTLKKIAELLYQYGQAVRSKTGVGLGQQCLQQYRSAVWHRIPPEKYYLYAIYSDAARTEQYIPAYWWRRLLETLIDMQGPEDAALLDDKRASLQYFKQHRLPVLPVLAEFENGATIHREWPENTSLPTQDLFSKPSGQRQAKGARRWFFVGDNEYRTEEGELVSQDEILRRLRAQSRQDVILLQERARNHPLIQELTGPTLTAMRIITMRSPKGKPRYLIGFISLPLGDVIGSNTRFGVLHAPIDEATGQLGAAYDRSDTARIMDPVPVHPMTGERIEGFQLPFWKESVELALRAHETLPTIALVGWDIALTAEGPVIIEGNKTPGGDSAQVAHKMPWGATDFPKLYVENLEMATENK
jgi:hypothetical protein